MAEQANVVWEYIGQDEACGICRRRAGWVLQTWERWWDRQPAPRYRYRCHKHRKRL